MKLGLGLPVSGAWATPEMIATIATDAEKAGYASLWSFQRLLIPAGAKMDAVYQSVLDPMAPLAFAAALTRTIRLGVAVINIPFVSPAYLAKQAATIDVLSNGRHDLGLGIGWMPEEFTLSGATMPRRGARMEEYVRVLRTLWGPQPAEFEGEFYQVPHGTMAPAPVQHGGPPVLIGGLARAALERAGRIGDGWVTSSRTDLSKISGSIEIVREAAVAAGRDPASVRVICRGLVREGAEAFAEGDQRILLSGSPTTIREDVAWLAEQGVTEIFFDLNWDPKIGSTDADPAYIADRTAYLLDALAPDAP